MFRIIKLFTSVLLFNMVQLLTQPIQQWSDVYNGPLNDEDTPYIIKTDNNGDIYIAGETKHFNQYHDYIVIKYNSTGTRLWSTVFNGPGNAHDTPADMVIDESGNIYVCGYYNVNGMARAAIVKFNNNGDILWNVHILDSEGQGMFYKIVSDNLGNIYAAGFTSSYAILTKYNNNGTLLMEKLYKYQNNNSQSFTDIVLTSNNIYLCGRTGLANNNFDALIIKFDQQANVIWSQIYNSPDNKFDSFSDLEIDNMENLYVCGTSENSYLYSGGLTIKYNSSGVFQWINRLLYNGKHNYIYKLKKDASNNIYAAGQYDINTQISGPGIIKYSNNGIIQWIKTDKSNLTTKDLFCDFGVDNNSNLYVSSSCYTPSSLTASYSKIVKFNSNGILKWVNYKVEQITNPSIEYKPTASINLDMNNNIYLASTGSSSLNLNNINTTKYQQIFHSVSGQVTYRDNNQYVEGGYVKALYYDESSSQIITVDSSIILPNGHYSLTKIPEDSLYIMFYQNDDLLQFVPTYYVSTLDWREATKIYATQNLTNINGQVFRINNQNNPFNISGLCVQNGNSNQTIEIMDAIIYAKIGNEFMNYGFSNSNGLYTVTKLPAGSYTVIAYRLGFAPITHNLTISNNNINGLIFNFGYPIGIQKYSNEIPNEFDLHQNYPNPFNPLTNIKFSLPVETKVKISVYDILGRVLDILVDGVLKAGTYTVNWNAMNYSSGVYVYTLETSEFILTKKMIFMK